MSNPEFTSTVGSQRESQYGLRPTPNQEFDASLSTNHNPSNIIDAQGDSYVDEDTPELHPSSIRSADYQVEPSPRTK